MTVDAQCRAVLIVFHFSDNTNICSFQVNICQFSDLTLLVDRKDICPVKKILIVFLYVQVNVRILKMVEPVCIIATAKVTITGNVIECSSSKL